ncbi:hypothetical protein IMT69_002114 [Salmonella enterica]|nr:hypothetical protein [Salmonella enterica]EGL7282675.1 hypothetical protein [Salmonella enterica]EGM5504384.1 hypothetical protein [Salmonella enterica]EGM5523161.1 hypothetical protein [Salmonella enterica]EHK6449994.1 hypothetical protein [Salmonella enterica]
MTTTLNPTITITVSGPTGSGKSRVLALIADVLKLYHGDDIIIDSPELDSEKRINPKGYAHWHSPRSGTLFKLEEINQPINTGRCIAIPITLEDLVDRTVPVHIQPLMGRLGISFEEGTETDLQPVIDLANWANAARTGVGYIPPEGWRCRSANSTTEPECAIMSDKDSVIRTLPEPE